MQRTTGRVVANRAGLAGQLIGLLCGEEPWPTAETRAVGGAAARCAVGCGPAALRVLRQRRTGQGCSEANPASSRRWVAAARGQGVGRVGLVSSAMAQGGITFSLYYE